MANRLRMKHLLFRLFAYIVGTAAGIYFRDFWLSDWGPTTFVLLIWLMVSLGLTWQGWGNRPNFRLGLTVGTAIALTIAVCGFVNLYVGFALMLLLMYLGFKT